MEPFFDFVSDFWWLVFPLSGLMGGWARSWSKASERRHRRRVELYQLRNRAAEVEQASQAEVQSLLAAHDDVNRRWLAYELDVGKLIDFPVMTDVREPLTVAFLRAKREADGLRPATPGEVTSAARLMDYRAAVRGFEVAFDSAPPPGMLSRPAATSRSMTSAMGSPLIREMCSTSGGDSACSLNSGYRAFTARNRSSYH